MFIDPDILKTTGFLVVDGEPVSTVFFVQMPLSRVEGPGMVAHYAVTTRHSVKGKNISIRLNEKWGGIVDIPTNHGDWVRNKETDIAVLPIRFPLKEYDVQFISSHLMVKEKDYLISFEQTRDRWIMAHRYGVGDEVFSIGLFYPHPGENTIHPAARFGHIAMMPVATEKLWADIDNNGTDVQIEAFLIEIYHTMAGQSGSPVFLRPWVNEKRTVLRPISELVFLVGMIQGYYPIEYDARLQSKKITITGETGLSIVIPTRLILDTLMEDELVKDREEQLRKAQEEREKKRIKPKALSRPPADEQGFTKESFEDALRRASQKLPSEPTSEKGKE